MSPRLFLIRLSCVLGVLSIPFAWAGSTWLAEQQRNTRYLEEKFALQQRQQQLQTEQEQLQQEIDRLRERAGLPKVGSTPTSQPPTSQSPTLKPNSSENFEENPESAESSKNSEIPQLPSSFSQLPSPYSGKGQGGAVEPDRLMQNTQSRLNSLWNQIRDLNPSLEATLNREEVIPQGMPMQGDNLVITSLFGSRTNPFGYGTEVHNGVDFVDAYASPVYATAPGIVIGAGFDGGYGLVVTINHSYGYTTLYAHLSGIAVKPDTRVKRGQLIGYLGNSGRSTGPHLHYSIYQGEKAIDPQSYLKLEPEEFQKLINIQE